MIAQLIGFSHHVKANAYMVEAGTQGHDVYSAQVPCSSSSQRQTCFRTCPDVLLFIQLIPARTRAKTLSYTMSVRPTEGHRKPRGYWSIRANVVEALQTFARTTYSPHVMPTAANLLSAGRADLLRAVQRNGGFAKLADHAGLLPNRRRRGFWSDCGSDGGLEHVKREICKLQDAKKIESGILPSAETLRVLGRDDLVIAILCSGGFSKIASALKLLSPTRGRPRILKTSETQKCCMVNTPKERDDREQVRKRKSPYYWNSWRFVKIQVRRFALTYCEGHMPLQRELLDNARSDLVNAIRIHGGFAHVARRTGLTPALSVKYRRPKGYWTDPAVLHGELLTFMTRYGYPGVMPRREQLLKAGRSDIVYGLRKHGGYSAVAADLHLVWHGPSNFWRAFRNLQKRVLAFLKKHGMTLMPSIELLHDHGRTDLIHGIALHGGVMVVARRIGLVVRFPERKDGYWEQPKNIQRELRALIIKRPLETQGYMPSSVALVQAGRADLATAIRDHGGWVYYGQRLGLRFAFDVKGQGFWQREANVLRELVSYVEKRYGTWEFPGRSHPTDAEQIRKGHKQVHVPCLEMLKRDGRSDIAFAMGRYHGGIEAFARKYDLRIAGDVVSTMPAESLTKWIVFASEMEDWISHYGSLGIMPMRQDLIRTGRNDLRFAMYKHGGVDKVSKRLQYVYPESPVSFWLPQWLGLQAGRLGILLRLDQKPVLSKMAQLLMKKLNHHLHSKLSASHRSNLRNSNGVPHKGSWLNKLHRRESRRQRRGKKRKRVEHVGKTSHKLTEGELDALRQRYKHLPPDDIIRI